MITKRKFIQLLATIVIPLMGMTSCIFSSTELTTPPAGNDTFGYIKDSKGNAIEGVVVTDGFSTTVSDNDGLYAISRSEEADFVYYSLPAGYAVSLEGKYQTPTFYKSLDEETERYDFTLDKLSSSEDRFNLICIGDPQVRSEANIERFRREVAPDIKAFVESSNNPCYALTLGDIVDNTWHLYPGIAEALSPANTGVATYQTIGNHDHQFPTANDDASRKIYESFYGPANYSFNRGKVHIISMDNIMHGCQKSPGYDAGFTKEQFEWLKSDLSYISKDRTIIFAVHIPFRQGAKLGGSSVNYDKYYHEILALLAEYKDVTILSAHTHTNINYTHNVGEKKIQEYIIGTTCGVWWKSTICGDGTPVGYKVLSFDGDKIVGSVYKAANHSEEYQIRLYRSTDTFSCGDKDVKYKWENGRAGRIIANVWDYDPTWSVKVYEDDVLSGEMTQFEGRDIWSQAYHMGALGNKVTHAPITNHLFYYDLKDVDAKVRVEVTNRYGEVYTQSTYLDPESAPVVK